MLQKLNAAIFALIGVLVITFAISAQDEKKTGTVIGILKSQKGVNDNKNTMIEVLAPGEEKARSYFVNHDPKIKGPLPKVLAAVRAAKVGERVELEWVYTGHGPAITAFKVLTKDAAGDKDKK